MHGSMPSENLNEMNEMQFMSNISGTNNENTTPPVILTTRTKNRVEQAFRGLAPVNINDESLLLEAYKRGMVTDSQIAEALLSTQGQRPVIPVSTTEPLSQEYFKKFAERQDSLTFQISNGKQGIDGFVMFEILRSAESSQIQLHSSEEEALNDKVRAKLFENQIVTFPIILVHELFSAQHSLTPALCHRVFATAIENSVKNVAAACLTGMKIGSLVHSIGNKKIIDLINRHLKMTPQLVIERERSIKVDSELANKLAECANISAPETNNDGDIQLSITFSFKLFTGDVKHWKMEKFY